VIIDSIYPTVATDDFARRFSQRGGNLMWLLGAGASAAASIPTAWDMIWEFKQQLYVSQRRVSPKQVAELFTPNRSGHVGTASATAALIAAAVAGVAAAAPPATPMVVENHFHDCRDPQATAREVERAMRRIAERQRAALHD
jgi:hypothetical protein